MIPQMVPWVTNPEQFTLRTVTGVLHFGNISDISSNLSFSRKKKNLIGFVTSTVATNCSSKIHG